MSAEMEIYEDKDMANKIAESSAFSDNTEMEKEAGPMLDKVVKGAKTFAKNNTKKANSWRREIGRDIKNIDNKRNLRKLKTKMDDSKKAYKAVAPKKPMTNKEEIKELNKARSGLNKTVKKLNRRDKLDGKAISAKSLAVGAGVGVTAGTAGGAYGASEYAKLKNSNTINKEASIDKEAGRFGFLRNGVKSMMMKANMGSSRVAKLKGVEASRKARDVNTAALKGKHNAELSSGRYKGMEGALAKRQAGESAAAKSTYQKGINSQNLPNTKTMGVKPAPRGGVDLGRMSTANSKTNWGKPTPSGGVNLGAMTPKATKAVDATARKAAKVKPVAPKAKPQVGAVNLGKMNVSKPTKPTVAPVNNSIFNGGKMPAMNARNLKRAGAGAVGLTAGSQVYDGIGGGGNRRINHNYM